jgi:TatD DNase family protein
MVGGKEVPDARVQMHCFSGSPELALEYVKLGATMSLGGPVTFKNGKKAAEVVRQLPVEYLMSETDAPYMAPEPLRGRPNKSPYIEHIVRRMSILKGLDYGETAGILTENGKHFFGIK